jgi:hypothetical protein
VCYFLHGSLLGYGSQLWKFFCSRPYVVSGWLPSDNSQLTHYSNCRIGRYIASSRTVQETPPPQEFLFVACVSVAAETCSVMLQYIYIGHCLHPLLVLFVQTCLEVHKHQLILVLGIEILRPDFDSILRLISQFRTQSFPYIPIDTVQH